MSKRSTNLENLLKQKEVLESKIYELQRQLLGIEKSISKIEKVGSTESSSSKTFSEIKSF